MLPLATGEVRWLERTVTGPGVLEWTDRVTQGGYPDYTRRVTLDGAGTLPLNPIPWWETNRLHIPAGVHTVRWTCETEFYGDEPYQVQTDAIWQIGNVIFTPGVSALMEGLDDEEMFWLVVGDAEGGPVRAPESHDGEDAWSFGEETVLYLCNPTTRWINGRAMVFSPGETGQNPEWAPASRWAGPGESVVWLRAGSQPPCFVDRFMAKRIAAVTFDEAVDGDHGVAAGGWIGLAETDEASDGIDAAWSYLTERYGERIASMTLRGPAKMRFRWKCSGTGTLGLRVDGAWLPVAVPGSEWQEVEFEVHEPAEIEWVHAPTSLTGEMAPTEAWLDSIAIESRPLRTIDAVAGEGSGLAFASTANSEGAGRWRATAYRDADGVWQEGARGITGAGTLQTTVTGPALLSFRSYCASVEVPSPVVQSSALLARSVSSWSGYDIITEQRFLSVMVGDTRKLQIIPEAGDGWTDHLIHVPAGEHNVVWQLAETIGVGPSSRSMPEWQTWVSDVALQHPRAHYEAWAAQALEGSTARGPGDDADGDGFINFAEYARGSDPENGLSKPTGIFGVVETALSFSGDEPPGREFALHVPRFPAHIPAVLKTSSDLVTWTPSTVRLRSYPLLSSGSFLIPDRSDSDSGNHQVVRFAMVPEQPARFFRIDLELPEADH